jgi:preprotein translocase subunit YajC
VRAGSIFGEWLSSPAGLGRFLNCGKGEMIAPFAVTVPALLVLQAPSTPGLLGGFLPIVAIVAIFYFLMIMPAQRRQKKSTEMLKSLKNGDKVITNGGIYGTIVGLEDDAIQLRIAEQVKIKISRGAIAGLQAESKEN